LTIGEAANAKPASAYPLSAHIVDLGSWHDPEEEISDGKVRP